MKIKKVSKMVKPFSNGTEFMVWNDQNCCRCKKYETESTKEEDAGYKLAFHQDLGCILGEIPEWVAQEIGCELHEQGDTTFAYLSNQCSKIEYESEVK